MEAEPNDTPLQANGPVPADGWLPTKGTSNDLDYAWLNLQARQQVSVSVSYVSGCKTNYQHPAPWKVEALDAFGRSRWTWSEYEASTRTWTTPDQPVRLNMRFNDANTVGCTVLFKVAPASAILDGPLPAPPARTLQVGLPGSLVRGTTTQVTLSGSAYLGDKAGYRLIPADAGPCPSSSDYPTTDDPGRSDDTWTGALLTGTYSAPLRLSLPKKKGNYLLCAWLQNTDGSGLSTIAGTTAVAVTGPPRPSAQVLTPSVPRGTPLQARVLHTSGKVLVTFTRGGKRRKSANVTVRGGQIAVTTKRLRRGTYRVGIWSGDRRLTAASVTIT